MSPTGSTLTRWLVFVSLLVACPVGAQVLDARRLGMGGVVLSDGGGSSSQNVAYRAVPHGGDLGHRSIPLPLGLIQFAANHPTFDSKDSTFNAFELANLAFHPPFLIQLIKPKALESDLVIDVARNSLTVDLGDLQRLFPKSETHLGSVLHAPTIDFGFRNLFVGLGPEIEARNSMKLDPNLQGALGDAQPFRPNTTYGTDDAIRGQAAAAIFGGVALPLVKLTAGVENGDPRKGGVALYGGVRAKYLRGIALLRADTHATFTTADTIFGTNNPLSVQYVSDVRKTGNGQIGGGSGVGFDLGAVLFVDRLELGLGVNDLAATIHWDKTDLDRFTYDSVADNNLKTSLEHDAKYKSTFPFSGAFNVAYRSGSTIFAGTLERNVNGQYLPHVGIERVVGIIPVRAGGYLDSHKLPQFTAGSGLKFGSVGLDVALATVSPGFTESRGVDLAASITLY